jgi:thiol-disulfide isomerase/thioredoxin
MKNCNHTLKRLIFYLVFSLLTTNLNAKESDTITSIFIENLDKSSIGIQREIFYDSLFERFNSNIEHDTLIFETQKPFRLVFDFKDADNQQVYVTFLLNPGEKIEIRKDKQGIRAVAKNNFIRTNELNFFAEMQKKVGNFEGLITYIPHKRKNSESLLNAVLELYQKRVDFLNSYKVEQQISEKFEKDVINIFFEKQFFEFFDHCSLDGILEKDILYQSQNVRSFIQKEVQRNQGYYYIYHLETEKFLSKLSLLEDNNWYNYYFKVKDNYIGDIQQYLMLKIIDESIKDPRFGVLVIDFLSSSMPDNYNDYVVKSYGDFVEPNLSFGEIDTLNNITYLYNLKTKKIINWEELLKSDGTKYLDFWATWCGGCRGSFTKVKELQKENLAKGLRVIYISIDERSGVWEKISKKENLPDENSYLVLNYNNSSLKKAYSMQGIPRYMIVDKHGTIINQNAPMPYNSKLKEVLDVLQLNE